MSLKKKKRIGTILAVVLLGLSLGYAYLNTTLEINGITNVESNTWNIYWDNVVVTNGSVASNNPTITNQTTVSFATHLQKPGDFYEFTVDAVNDGSIDAMIDSISSKLNGVTITNLPDYLLYSIMYDDGAAIAENQLLKSNTSETYKIRVEYKKDVTSTQLPSTNQELNFEFSVTYVQADSSATMVPHYADFSLGDYFTLVPDSSSYTIDSSLTGYTSTTQTITPNELTLWRVIITNADGTVDAISEYASSETVAFYGATGYSHLVEGLQTIAAQYAKTGYTVNTRAFGYDGQTLVVDDSLIQRAPPVSTTSTQTPTSGTGVEYNGGVAGDTLYLKDYLSVIAVYGNTAAYQEGTTTIATYWVASRRYGYYGNLDWGYSGRNADAGMTQSSLYTMGNGFRSQTSFSRIRPIITLKSNLRVTAGDGTKDNPYILTDS